MVPPHFLPSPPTVGHLVTNGPALTPPTLPRTVGVGPLSVGWVAGWLAGGLPAQLAGRLSANFFFAPAAGLLFVGRGGKKSSLQAPKILLGAYGSLFN